MDLNFVVTDIREQSETDKGWELIQEKEGIKIFSKEMENSVTGFKGVGIVNFPAKYVVCFTRLPTEHS